MNDPQSNEPELSRDELLSALFAQMVLQQANMAMMLLGKMPHPQTGETVQDFEAAKFFIDQLEMLEAKTKGNLSKQEEQLLKQSLTTLRMAFVEAVQSAPAPQGSQAAPAVEEKASAPAEAPAPTLSEEESKKKFTKKY
jgi:hypothetical protein